jgi:hypothetical protein
MNRCIWQRRLIGYSLVLLWFIALFFLTENMELYIFLVIDKTKDVIGIRFDKFWTLRSYAVLFVAR